MDQPLWKNSLAVFLFCFVLVFIKVNTHLWCEPTISFLDVHTKKKKKRKKEKSYSHYCTQKFLAAKMAFSGQRDQQIVVRSYTGILLSNIKQRVWDTGNILEES